MSGRSLTSAVVAGLLLCGPLGGGAAQAQSSRKGATNVHQFTVKNIDGKEVPLSAYQGKVLLVVNVASFCGYTKQYAGLDSLSRTYAGRGLAVLGFPANNFGSQEPGTDAEIKEFCTTKYGVSFDMFAKISVKGEDQHPLFRYLTSADANPATAGDIRWNFTKFLVDRTGRVIARFEPRVDPLSEDLRSAVETALGKE